MRKRIFQLLVISTLVILAIVMTRSATGSADGARETARNGANNFAWEAIQAAVPSERAGATTYEYTIRKKVGQVREARMTVREVMNGWATDEEFRRFYVTQLRAAPFEAAFWETPPALTTTLDSVFRYVLVDSPGLARVREERDAFQEHFVPQQDNMGVAAFYNLGGSSRLIAPAPVDGIGNNNNNRRNYAHFLAFLRTAPEIQATKILRVISTEFMEALDEKKAVWLSTAGMGVFYTHVRLDPRPKYYRYRPYKTL